LYFYYLLSKKLLLHSGSDERRLLIPALWLFAEGLYCFLEFFLEKEGFLKIIWYNEYRKF